MKTLECIELLQLADEGGIFTDESRYDVGTMLTVLNAARAFAITELYSKNNRVHPNFIQRVYPEYKEAIQQSDCYNLFEIPRTVEINDKMDGLMYVGSIKGNEAYSKIRTRMQLNSRRNQRVHKLYMNKKTHFLYDATRGYLEIYDPKVKYPLVEGVFEDPTSLPQFSFDEDDYPITANAMKRIEDLVRRGTILDSVRIPVNKTSNSQEDSSVQRDVQAK